MKKIFTLLLSLTVFILAANAQETVIKHTGTVEKGDINSFQLGPKIVDSLNLIYKLAPQKEAVKSELLVGGPLAPDAFPKLENINESLDQKNLQKIVERSASIELKANGPVMMLPEKEITPLPEGQELQKSGLQEVTETTQGQGPVKIEVEEMQPGIETFQQKTPDNLKTEGTFKASADDVSLKSALAGENLTPYQPSGWDNKLVISAVTGTHTSVTTILPTTTLYVDWAVINNGTAATTATFYHYLYVDNVKRAQWTTGPGLSPNYYVYISDYSIGTLLPGTHTIRITTDATNTVVETNESDNSYSRSIFVSGPDIDPYQPTGWDNKIVVSAVTGTNTSTSPLFNTQTLYVDWALVNVGALASTATIYSRLYVDEVLKGTWTTGALNPSAWQYVADHNIGALATGSHTIKIVVDATNVVAETNESDNTYIRTITVSPLLNLKPYQPAGWDSPLVISKVAGTTTSVTTFLPTDNIYVDCSMANYGPYATANPFYIDILVDGVLKTYWSIASPFASGAISSHLDYLVGKLAPGTHTITLRLDQSPAQVPESNEADNVLTRTINVVGPNLTPYQPTGYDNKLVVSTVTGTHTSTTPLFNNQALYVDWVVINNGTAAISSTTFYYYLYVDGVLKTSWTASSLATGAYHTVNDFNIGILAAGTHTIRILADATGTITELNEADNEYTRTITVNPYVNLTPYQPAGWDNKIVLSTVTGTTTTAPKITTNDNIYLDWSVANYGTSATAHDFYVCFYLDGVHTAHWYQGIGAYTYITHLDYLVGKLSAGTHTFMIRVDLDGYVTEFNEGDNIYSRTYVIDVADGTKPLGNTDIYSTVSVANNRTAFPVTFTEAGTIQSLSIYHSAGSGGMMLGVYSNASGAPGTLLGVTAPTTVTAATGWQTVPLITPVPVTLGQTVWLAWVFQTNPGIRYTTGTPARARSTATWAGGMPGTFGTAEYANYKYSVYCNYVAGGGPAPKTLGNTTVYETVSVANNRTAFPVTFTEAGTIQSLSIYHSAGSGGMMLGVYSNASGAPGTLLGVTAATTVTAATGWQTVPLITPVPVSLGQTVWLAWVFQTNPGIRYTTGTPARARSTATWAGGMPGTFGTAEYANYKYSLYCNYLAGGPTPKNLGNTTVYSTVSVANNRTALPVTFTEAGTIHSLSIYHSAGSGGVMLGVYSNAAGTPGTLLGVTAPTTVSAVTGWQTIPLITTVPVSSGQTVWLSWVFQTNPGIRYTTGTPARARSTATWAGGMPGTFGAAEYADYKYSVYCTYSTAPEAAQDEFKSGGDKAFKPDDGIAGLDKVDIYPNPTNESVTVRWKNNYENGLTLTIYSSLGNLVKKVKVQPQVNEIQVDLSGFSSGIYLMELKDKTNGMTIKTTRVIKK